MTLRSILCSAAVTVACASLGHAQQSLSATVAAEEKPTTSSPPKAETPPPAAVQAQPATPAAPATKLPPEQLLEFYGWAVGRNASLDALGLNQEEMAAVVRGLETAGKGGHPPSDPQVTGPAMGGFLRTRAAEVAARHTTENKAEEEKFFAELDKNPAIKKTASGLRYEIVNPGQGTHPTERDTVSVNYRGTFANGTEFDRSAGGKPVQFALNGVIPAWTEGVQLIGPGGRMKLYVPSALGYGEAGRDGIPPAKMLVFDIELLDVQMEKPTLAPTGAGQPTLEP